MTISSKRGCLKSPRKSEKPPPPALTSTLAPDAFEGERAFAGVSKQAEELRNQGQRAVAGVSQQVEHNPLTSLAVAFALGWLIATLIRR